MPSCCVIQLAASTSPPPPFFPAACLPVRLVMQAQVCIGLLPGGIAHAGPAIGEHPADAAALRLLLARGGNVCERAAQGVPAPGGRGARVAGGRLQSSQGGCHSHVPSS